MASTVAWALVAQDDVTCRAVESAMTLTHRIHTAPMARAILIARLRDHRAVIAYEADVAVAGPIEACTMPCAVAWATSDYNCTCSCAAHSAVVRSSTHSDREW